MIDFQNLPQASVDTLFCATQLITYGTEQLFSDIKLQPRYIVNHKIILEQMKIYFFNKCHLKQENQLMRVSEKIIMGLTQQDTLPSPLPDISQLKAHYRELLDVIFHEDYQKISEIKKKFEENQQLYSQIEIITLIVEHIPTFLQGSYENLKSLLTGTQVQFDIPTQEYISKQICEINKLLLQDEISIDQTSGCKVFLKFLQEKYDQAIDSFSDCIKKIIGWVVRKKIIIKIPIVFFSLLSKFTNSEQTSDYLRQIDLMDWDDDVDYQFKNVNQRLKELSDGQYCDSFQELFEQIKIIYNCDENQKKLEANQLLTAKQFILDFIELGTYFIVKKFTNENLDEDKMFDNLINSFSDFVNTDERMESYRGIVGLCLTMVRNSQEKKKENKEKRKVGKKTCEEQPYQSEIQQILSDMGQNKFPECFNSSNYPDTYNYLVEQINQSYQNDENYQNYQNQKNQQNQQNDQNSDLDSEIEDQNSQIEDQNSQMDYSDEDQNEDFSIDDENYLDSSKTKTRQHYQTNETDKKNIFEFN